MHVQEIKGGYIQGVGDKINSIAFHENLASNLE